MHEIDARVEQRHRDPCAREAGNADVGPPAAGDAEEVVDAAGIDRGGDRRPHGEDPFTSGSRTAIASVRASSGVAKPLNTR